VAHIPFCSGQLLVNMLLVYIHSQAAEIMKLPMCIAYHCYLLLQCSRLYLQHSTVQAPVNCAATAEHQLG
jgi:hypothetical protein